MKTMVALLKYTYTSVQSASIVVGRRLLFKTFFIDFMLHLLMYAEHMWFQRDLGPEYLLSFSLNSAAVLQLVAAANIIQCALLWGIFLYRLINERIRLTIGSVLQMDENVAYWNGAYTEKQLIFNHICRQLNILRGQHYNLMESIRNIVHFYNLPLALIMCHQFLIIISELFYAYTS
uniref:Gustatory receptor n=1 Tax=Anopheles atroparvus TaxID=41427 RepID=A0AAG5D2N4_ANOAO